jgi:hypothetical protein
MSEQFGTLTQRPDHPASPVLLTKNGPLRIVYFYDGSIKKRAVSYPFKV